MNAINPNRPDLFSTSKPPLTRPDVARLLGVKLPAVIKWEKQGKIKAIARTTGGGAIFSSEDLLVALRETISMGFLPVLSKRKKRCRQS